MQEKVKYFIYARKSTEGFDRQILSIEGQLSELQKIVKRDNLQVIDTYVESKSAHKPNNRPQFSEMIKRINCGEANGIIAWHINRLSRNPKESGEIQQLLQDRKIVSIIVPYREFKSEDNALLFSIETSEANQYSRDLSVSVKRGLKQKCEMGYPPSIAQLGYLNTKSNIRGSNKITIDHKRWVVIRRAFDLILSNKYTVTEILDIVNNQYGLRTRPGKLRGGRPLSKAGLYRIYTDPFYYGYFYHNGILYKGSYKPMITVQEYDAIQTILGRNGKPRPKKHVFAYTGLIHCGECGSAITASEKRKFIKSIQNNKYYIFYHCTHRKNGASHCSQKNFIPVEKIEEMIIAEFKKYEIRPKFKEWVLEVAKENYQGEYEKQKRLIASELQHENKLQQEINNLIDLRISQSISEEVYVEKKNQREEQLVRIRVIRQAREKQSTDWLMPFENRLNFTTDIVERFGNSDLFTKKEMCTQFGWNWTLKDKKLFIDKMEWLEPIRNFRDGVMDVFKQLEPNNMLENKGSNSPLDHIRLLVCGLVDDVGTQ